MRKVIVSLLIMVSFANILFADEPVPVLRPAAPDVKTEVPSDDSDYLPNVIKQHNNQTEKNSVKEDSNQEDIEYEEIEEDVKQEPDATQINNSSETDTKVEDVLDGDANPINSDATEENIKNNNYTPAQEVVSDKKQKIKKVKQKKVKKEKPKYGKYKDADTDPYIQSWETLNNSEPSDDGQSAVGDGEEVKSKAYTQADYEQAYRDLQVPTFSFMHGVDPDQYYDMKDTMWSPYPLLRLNSPLYFKTITVEPGYYLLTPRKYKDGWYLLFKEAGTVKYIIPVFERSYTPVNYYRDNLREYDMSKSARWQVKFLDAWGKYIRKSKRRPATKCNVELTDLDNNFLLLDLYYGPHRYSTVFRIEKF